MAWNTGTFSREHNWVQDQGNGIKIRADRHDEEDDNLATGINTCLTKDGQNSPSADLPMATHKHTGVGNAAARNQYAAAGQVQDQSFTWCGTAGGTKNALTLTPSPAITAYAAGQRFVFKSGSTQSDDAVTVDVSGVGTKAIQSDGGALSATVFIEANKWYEITYDGAAFQASKITAVPLGLVAVGTTNTQTLTNKTLTNAIVGTQSPGDNSTKAASTAYVDAAALPAASQAEMESASSTVKTVTPGRAHYHPGMGKVWVKFDSAGNIAVDYGVASITKHATGDYTVTFDTAFSSANYAVFIGVETTSSGTVVRGVVANGGQAAGSVRINIQASAGGALDTTAIHVMCMGDL